MPKTIERPETTTRIYEVRVHVIRDEKELANVLTGTIESDIIPYSKGIDHNNLRPVIIFGIRSKVSDWMRDCKLYEVSLELAKDSMIEHLFTVWRSPDHHAWF
jgi:hypothetical protein